MATKRFYATRDLKNPSYGTRMLRAGDPVDLDGPKARLYIALGAVTPDKPRVARAAPTPPAPAATPPPAAPKSPRKRRRTAAKK